MNAAEAIKLASLVGIRIRLDGDDLVLEASIEPPPEVLKLLRNHKAGVKALLRDKHDRWSPDDWHARFDELAGVAEFDNGLSRDAAEACAFSSLIEEWLVSNAEDSLPNRCIGCGRAGGDNDPLLPLQGTNRGWLHSGCSASWHKSRRAEAVAALTLIGITPPVTLH